MKNGIGFRIMKTHEFDDSIYYRAACECNDGNHDLELMLEVDEDNIMSLIIRGKLKTTAHWHHYNIFERAWLRLKYSMILLFRGWFHLHHDFMIREERQIDDFIKAIESGKHQLIKNHEKSRQEAP